MQLVSNRHAMAIQLFFSESHPGTGPHGAARLRLAMEDLSQNLLKESADFKPAETPGGAKDGTPSS